MNIFIYFCFFLFSFFISINAYAEKIEKGTTLEEYMAFESKSIPNGRFYYGVDRENNYFDYYYPKKVDEKKLPIVVIHGGCWDHKYEGFKQSGEIIDYFLNHGHIVFNVEYTKASQGGGYPSTYNDIENALLNINSMLINYSLAKSELILIGHSAGGHLATWAASGDINSHTKEYLKSVKIKKAIGLGAIVDLSSADKACPNIINFGGVEKISGENIHYTSPIEMENNTAVFLINGELDNIAPISYAINYVNKKNDKLVSYHLMPGATHYDLMSSKSGVFDIILNNIEKINSFY